MLQYLAANSGGSILAIVESHNPQDFITDYYHHWKVFGLFSSFQALCYSEPENEKYLKQAHKKKGRVYVTLPLKGPGVGPQ